MGSQVITHVGRLPDTNNCCCVLLDLFVPMMKLVNQASLFPYTDHVNDKFQTNQPQRSIRGLVVTTIAQELDIMGDGSSRSEG